ncbi:hypothetical protein PN498_06095 [Oscillatoria sp. CS-180]|uniref:hypothetical protein n=1 Tax=Oscillatoria sp. CS-180 TaxID=3021720 RepID=UPI002330432D|nr:hypothetical protein [Oscillatoria sp. CS-180]MDB9525551.1 hypothetical protein [Oscillatoria sp. CS-180]
MESTLFDRAFKDNEGNLTIAQKPNPPLLVWLSATLLSLLPVTGNLQILFETISFGALFTWAWMELFQGVNYFRRFLGLTVLVIAIASKLNY